MSKYKNFANISACKVSMYMVPNSNVEEMSDLDIVKKAANRIVFDSADYEYTNRSLIEIFAAKYGGVSKTSKYNIDRLLRKLVFKIDIDGKFVDKTGLFTQSAVMQIIFVPKKNAIIKETTEVKARKNKRKLSRMVSESIYTNNILGNVLDVISDSKKAKADGRKKRRRELRAKRIKQALEKNSENESDEDMFVNQMMVEPDRNKSDNILLAGDVGQPSNLTNRLDNTRVFTPVSAADNTPINAPVIQPIQPIQPIQLTIQQAIPAISIRQYTTVEYIPQVGLYVESKVARTKTYKNQYEISIWQDIDKAEAVARSMVCENSSNFTEETNVRFLPNTQLTSLEDYAMMFQIDGITEQLIDLNSKRVIKSRYVKNPFDEISLEENRNVKKISTAQLKFNPFMGCENMA